MSRLCQTIRYDSQTSTDFISNKRVESSTFIRKDISGWDCEGDWGFGTVVAILCVYKKLGSVKREVEVKSQKKGQLTIQCDEIWSFVGNNDNKPWKELAIHVSTKEIVRVYIGKRYRAGAQGLWDSLPSVPESTDISKNFQYTFVTKFPAGERYKKQTSVSTLKSVLETVTVSNKAKDSRYTYQIPPVYIKDLSLVKLRLLSKVSQFHLGS
jgi:hypothetical protein